MVKIPPMPSSKTQPIPIPGKKNPIINIAFSKPKDASEFSALVGSPPTNGPKLKRMI